MGPKGVKIKTTPAETAIPILQSKPNMKLQLRIFLLTVLAVSLLPLSTGRFLRGQTATAEAGSRKTSTPYTGDLSIFEYKDRDQKLQIQRVMDILGIHAGTAVADVGAGSGWFTVRAARRVGAAGMVYASDINPQAITYIKQRASREGFANIQAIAGTEDDPRLPPRAIDCVLLLKTYHEIAHPLRLLENVRTALKPGARVGVIDRNGRGDDHGIARQIVIDEFKLAGFTLSQEYDFVKADGMDYFLVFTPVREYRG